MKLEIVITVSPIDVNVRVSNQALETEAEALRLALKRSEDALAAAVAAQGEKA
jgi:hypothetical protein